MPSSYTTQSGITLSRDTFIGHYMAAWLAASSNKRYWNGHASECALEQPIEDALVCAESVWEQIEEIKP